MNEYKTIIEERPYNLNPYNINVSGKLQIKNDYVFGFSKDSYISIPYILKSGFNKFLAKISFKRLMSTQQTLLSSSDEKNGFKSIFISRDNKLYYGDKFILDSINKSKEYNISFLFENKSLIVMIENERYEIDNIESFENVIFNIGKGDDRFSSYNLSKTFFKVDDKVVWFGGLNTLTLNNSIINLGYIPCDGYLITDEVKIIEPNLIRKSETIPLDTYCYWLNTLSKEFSLCYSGQKIKELEMPKFKVSSNGISVDKIIKYYETKEDVIKDIMGEN